jgi:hypothetical protein
MKNLVWTCSLDDYIEIMEQTIILGKEHGKSEGDNLIPEFFEIAKKLGKAPKCLGATEMDKDLLMGNIREDLKIKILDLTKKEDTNEPY